jgi:hypothetical protein
MGLREIGLAQKFLVKREKKISLKMHTGKSQITKVYLELLQIARSAFDIN